MHTWPCTYHPPESTANTRGTTTDPIVASIRRHEPNTTNTLAEKVSCKLCLHLLHVMYPHHQQSPTTTRVTSLLMCLWTVKNHQQNHSRCRANLTLASGTRQGPCLNPGVQLKTHTEEQHAKGPLEKISTRSAAAAGALLPRLHGLQETSHASTATPAGNLILTAPAAAIVQHIYSTTVQRQGQKRWRQPKTHSLSQQHFS